MGDGGILTNSEQTRHVFMIPYDYCILLILFHYLKKKGEEKVMN